MSNNEDFDFLDQHPIDLKMVNNLTRLVQAIELQERLSRFQNELDSKIDDLQEQILTSDGVNDFQESGFIVDYFRVLIQNIPSRRHPNQKALVTFEEDKEKPFNRPNVVVKLNGPIDIAKDIASRDPDFSNQEEIQDEIKFFFGDVEQEGSDDAE